ncbi:MAG: ROK family protein [Thermomicrobiales bacterium]
MEFLIANMIEKTPKTVSVYPEQIAIYQTDHLLSAYVCAFSPQRAVEKMQEPTEVLALDIGGDKLRRAQYRIEHGSLAKIDEQVFPSGKGKGYLAILEKIAEEVTTQQMAVGISSATKMEGSVISRTTNLDEFFAEFLDKYGADYAVLFPERSFVANDTITGLCGSSTLLTSQGRAIPESVFVISASGLGAAVLKDHQATHVEIAHVPVISALNPLGQTRHCHIEAKNYVCVERVAAARAGIEDIYVQQTGEKKDGVAISALYEHGDRLATTLYETSALLVAHATEGLRQRYQFTDSGVVIFHGGNFQISKYRQEVLRDLSAFSVSPEQIIFSRDLSQNVCLDGAAILATYFRR